MNEETLEQWVDRLEEILVEHMKQTAAAQAALVKTLLGDSQYEMEQYRKYYLGLLTVADQAVTAVKDAARMSDTPMGARLRKCKKFDEMVEWMFEALGESEGNDV